MSAPANHAARGCHSSSVLCIQETSYLSRPTGAVLRLLESVKGRA